MAALVAVALLYVVGLPAGFALTGRVTTGLLVAPLVSGLIAAVAGVAVAAVGGPLMVWFAVVGVTSVIAAWTAVGRPRSLREIRSYPHRPRLGGLDGWDVVFLVLPFVVLSLRAFGPPAEWDARSIWWFHASWFWGGGATLQPALANPALAFSHADYPPLLPATIAAAWHASRTVSLQIALQLSTLLTMTALATLGFVVRRLVPSASAWWGRLAGLAVALSAWMLASRGPTSGLTDHLWPASIAAGAVLLLLPTRPADARRGSAPVGFALAIALAGVAALTKNEGLVCAGALAVVYTVRERKDLRRAAWAWVPVGAGLVWVFVARHRGAVSDLAGSPRVDQLLHGDFTALDRIDPALEGMRGIVGWFVLGSAVVSVLGTLCLRRARRRVGLGSVGWIWSVVALYVAALLLTYVVSPWDIGWHVITSVDRVMVLVVVLLAAVNASWFLTAIARARPSAPSGAWSVDDGIDASAPATSAAAEAEPVAP